MKKLYLMLAAVFMTILTIDNVHAEDLYYLPAVGSNYFRSQHTYSFYNKNGEYHDEFAPTVSDLIKDKGEDLNYSNFASKYKIPWTVAEQNYVITLCADLDIDIVDLAQYRKVPIMQSTYINNDAKTHVIGMLKKSYPFISKDEMLDNLVKENILVIKDVDGKKIYTSKENTNPTISLTDDEIISALQLAIYNYTNPGQVKDIYYDTVTLTGDTVMRINNLQSNIYADGVNEEVSNNIMALYNYFLQQNDDDAIFNVREAKATQEADTYTIHVLTNRKINDKDDLKVALYKNEEKVAEYNLKDLKTDKNGAYIFNVVKLDNLDEGVKVTVTGKEYAYDGVYVYEAVEGKDYAQTQVGISTDYRTVYSETAVAGAFKENPNIKVPNTLDNIFKYILILAGGGVILLLAVLLKLKKKKS